MSAGISPTAVICLSAGRGGMEHDAVKLAGLLSECGDVVLVSKKNAFIEELYRKGEYSFACETVSFLNKSFSLSMLLMARKILESYDIENVVYLGASELKTLYFSFLGKALNVIVRHGTTKSRPKRDLFHKLVYSCVSCHVAISEHLLANVNQIVPHNAGVRFEKIYPSFSINQNGDSPFDAEQVIRILHVGRIARGKGQLDAILACHSLHQKGIDFELLFIGGDEDKNYADEVKQYAADVAYRDSIRFLGYVEDVGRYMCHADLLLYPSFGEGFGNVFVEAMAHGLSAVTYSNTTFPEFRRLGFVFRLAADRDIESLADNLVQAVENIDNDKAACTANRKLAADVFDREKEKAAWCRLLR